MAYHARARVSNTKLWRKPRPLGRPSLAALRKMVAAETPLFDDIVLTSLERSPSGGLRPTLVFAASGTTASSSQQTAAVLEFTWADADDDSILSSAADAFTFTLTQDDGVRCFGFCRRLAQPAKPPVCLCVLSRRPWFSLCARVLDFLKPHVDAHADLRTTSDFSSFS